MNPVIVTKALLLVLLSLCMNASVIADEKDKTKNKPAKVSKKMHEYLMSRVANKHVLTKKGGPKVNGGKGQSPSNGGRTNNQQGQSPSNAW